MAKGLATLHKTDVAIAVTGIAGPDGGTPKKPVGTVYIGIAIGDTVSSILLNIPSTFSRDEIRREAVFQILSLLKEKLS